jgi:5-methylcytosine-specific restriction endonuclease McrA
MSEQRYCGKCGEWKPATREHFYQRLRDGRVCWRNPCIECYRRTKQYNEQVAERTRRHRAEHPDWWKEYGRRYRAEHPDMFKAAQKRSYAKYADRNREQARKYAHTHREQRRTIEAQRRARKQEAGGNYTTGEWEALKAQYDNRCLCCGKQEPEIKLTQDHIIPLSKGGSNFISNIQPLCGLCNSRKAQRTIDYRKTHLQS